jgi:hypothetical protein
MQQRRLRLGDILDDYCPRERRITNHAIVAMIDDEVKQTRCTTCDADHEYKQARVPPPRRKKEPVVQTRPEEETPLTDTLAEELPVEDTPAEAAPITEEPVQQAQAPTTEAENGNETDNREDEGPVHRRLIRATLPRPEGQSPERKIPEFTVRQPGGRGRDFNSNRTGGGGQRHGRGRRSARGAQGSFGGSSHFGAPRPNSPHGHRQNGNRSGPGGGQRGGGRPPGQPRGPGRKRGR